MSLVYEEGAERMRDLRGHEVSFFQTANIRLRSYSPVAYQLLSMLSCLDCCLPAPLGSASTPLLSLAFSAT